MPKKGEFPARPPTLAEALYGDAEIGTRPENAESILKDLNLDALKKKPSSEVKGEKKRDEPIKPKKPAVQQVDASLTQPLPSDAPPNIDSNWITPDKSEAMINLQMDYILQRKSTFTKVILRSKLFSSSIVALISMYAYYTLNGYISDYTLRNGYWAATKDLFNNSYFVDDFTKVAFATASVLISGFVFVKFQSGFLQNESFDVADNLQTYFNCDLLEYSTIKSVQKPKKDEKDLVKFMKENSLVIDYRKAPVAFLVKKPIEGEENSYEIIGYGIRRVYVKAELFKDLLGLTFKELLKDGESFKLKIKVYSFEEFDIGILKKAGFIKTHSDNVSFFLSTFFNVTRDTYEFELDSVEF